MNKNKITELITDIYGLSGNMSFITSGLVNEIFNEIWTKSGKIIDILLENESDDEV